MKPWSPAASSEVTAIVERHLQECSPELVTFFDKIRVPPTQTPIARRGHEEQVFVVAELDGVVVYYEDVEDGFNLSALAPDGSIATPGFEQWDLRHALLRLQA